MAANEVYVADGYYNHRIIVFDRDNGAFKRMWGAYGKPPTDEKLGPYDPAAAPARQFANPVHCVRIAKDGLVYVCDRTNDRIQVFKKDGSFVTEFFVEKNTRANGSVWELALWPDANQTYLLNADGANNEVRTLERATGAVVGAFGRNGRMAGQFHWVHNLAVDSHGDVFTTEVDTGKRAQKFVPVGMWVCRTARLEARSRLTGGGPGGGRSRRPSARIRDVPPAGTCPVLNPGTTSRKPSLPSAIALDRLDRRSVSLRMTGALLVSLHATAGDALRTPAACPMVGESNPVEGEGTT